MRLPTGWLLSLALLLTAACSSGSGDDDDSSGGTSSSGTDTLTYPTGHPLSTDTTDAATISVEDQLLTLCNDHRVSQGSSALIDDPAGRRTARAHSKHMIVHDFFDHVNPEGDSPGDRLTANGVSWSIAGENIAAGQPTAQDAFNDWLASPGHKANIENPEFTHTGAGYWSDSSDSGTQVYYRYYTQVFTKP